jgi:hypothetical protein
MYSGEYDACDVTLSVYPHRASLKNMPGHGGNRTYDPWISIGLVFQQNQTEAESDMLEDSNLIEHDPTRKPGNVNKKPNKVPNPSRTISYPCIHVTLN